jgi:type IV pilus secretin PilQ/predicted competence protein
MVASKSGSVGKVAAALSASLMTVIAIACASSPELDPEPTSDGSQVGDSLSNLRVETGESSTTLTMEGVMDPVYTAIFNEELRAIVVDLSSVGITSDTDLVEVYDGLVDYVTVSSYDEGRGVAETRVEIAMAVDAEFDVIRGSDGLQLVMSESGSRADADPWSTGEAGFQANGDSSLDFEDEETIAAEGAVEQLAIEIPDPPMATRLVTVEVETTESGALIRLEGDGIIGSVESFSLESPVRFVMDLPGLSKTFEPSQIDVDHELVNRIRIGSHSDKIRVVIDGGPGAADFDSRAVRPVADGLYVALGSGQDLDEALAAGLAAADEAWRLEAMSNMNIATTVASEELDPASTEQMLNGMEIVAVEDGDVPSAQWDREPENSSETDGSGMTASPSDLAAANAAESSSIQIYGIHYQTIGETDRITVLSDEIVDYAMMEPDSDTLVLSFPGSVIADAVAGHVLGQKGGPVSLITIFQQPDVERDEVRLVVTRAANQKPVVEQKGTLLIVDFPYTGVAAVAPPAFPAETLNPATTVAESEVPGSDAGSAALTMETASGETVEITGEAMAAAEMPAGFEELPEFSENTSLDGPAGLDQDLADAGDAMPAAIDPTTGTLDDASSLPDFGADMPVAAPASLEPPAAVEVLQEGGLVDGKRYQGRRISLDFNDVPVADVLRLIAEVSDLNLIAGDEVRGSVTIRLVDVPWDQALDVVLLTKGLGFIRVGNILRVAPADIIAQEEELRLQERRNKEKLEDLDVKLLAVNYASVKDMEKLVKRLLSPRGTVNVDERTSTLIIKDIASVIDESVALVRAIDTETPQVMIEAKIVEAGLDFSRELGAEWALGSQPLEDPWDGSDPRRDLGNENFKFHGSNGVAFSNPITTTPTAALDMGAYLLDEKLDLNIALRAAESMGQGKVISSPRVVTLDNGEAMIEQGVSIPFQTFESGDAKLEFIDAVLSLKVIPHITSDRSIIMDIEVTRNAPDDSVATPTGSPAIAKAEAQTEALVKDGQTLVLGGIYTIVKSERESRVPYLYRIPVIGPAFRSKELTDTRKELLIFVTPRIVKSPEGASN